MALTSIQCRRGKDSCRQAVTPRQPVHEVTQQKWYFLFALPQGGHMHGERAQAVVEVFAQSPLGNGLFNVDLRGRQNAHIHLDPGVAA